MNKPTKDNPLQQTEVDRARIAENNAFNMQMNIDARLERIENHFVALYTKMEGIEEALSWMLFLPDRPMNLKYDAREKTLILQNRLKFELNETEASIISVMFGPKSGKPKNDHFIIDEVASDLAFMKNESYSKKAVHQTIVRIQNRLDSTFHTGNIIIYTTKVFYFSTLALK